MFGRKKKNNVIDFSENNENDEEFYDEYEPKKTVSEENTNNKEEVDINLNTKSLQTYNNETNSDNSFNQSNKEISFNNNTSNSTKQNNNHQDSFQSDVSGYKEKEYNSGFLESHTKVTGTSMVSRFLLFGFYLIFIIIGAVAVMMIIGNRYEFYLDQEEVVIGTGSSYQVKLTPKYLRYFDYLNYNYSVADTNVATVDEFGTVTAVGTGTTTLKISMRPGFKSKTMRIVSQNIEINSIKLGIVGLDKLEYADVYDIKLNQSIKIRAIANNQEDMSIGAKYSSNNSNIATVDEFGNVTPKNTGTVIISAESGGKTCQLKINVKKSSNSSTEPTKTPTPTVTTAPLETTSPVVTSEPVETTAPVVTSEPTKTVAPVVTSEPTKTTAPVVTSEPTKTTAPVVTSEPTKTTAPTTKPTKTKTPTAAPTSKATTKPTKTTAPTVAPTSKATTKPTKTTAPTAAPTSKATTKPTKTTAPTAAPTSKATTKPTKTTAPTAAPTVKPTTKPSTESQKVTKVVLNIDDTDLYVKNTLKLSVEKVEPSSITNYSVTWSSENEKVATVDSDGKVTAVAKGTAKITATVNGVSATCIIRIKEKSSETQATAKPTVKPTAAPSTESTFDSKYVKFSTQNIEVKKGATAKFKISAYNAAGVFSIKSSKTSIATVDKSTLWLDGVDEDTGKAKWADKEVTITGVAAGTTTIVIVPDPDQGIASYDVKTGTTDELIPVTGKHVINVTVK